MINNILEQISIIIKENAWLAPILALVAGILTSFTPCSLSNMPLIIGFVGGTKERNTKRAFGYSLTFALGTAITFVILGVVASSMGKLIGNGSKIWYIVLGVLMILMSLQTFEIINIIPSTNFIAKNKKTGFLGAFLMGILGGIFSSPCSTPVLIALLTIVASESNMLWGILLMLLYSIGHSILVVVAGTSIAFVQSINENQKYKKASSILKIIMGIAILLIGFYMLWLGL